MKKFAILAITIFVFTSCNTDDEIIDDNYFVGEWELVRTTGQFDDTERTGEEMAWQESYALNADGTFTKTRVRDNKTSVAEGTFTVDEDAETYGLPSIALVTMIYESNEIIATCYSDELKEVLYFETEDLMVSTWEQCDGLGLEYAKKED